jgi:O-antigen biosynthesis protein
MKVSVIVPCYDAEPYLAETLRSVLEQTRPADELVVVDDGSTDRSLEIAREFEPRVRVVAKENEGAPATRNRGAALAGGDALMFLDADDVLGPDALEALAGALERSPGAIAVCPWYRLELVDGRWVEGPPSCHPRRPGHDYLESWLCRWYHPPCSVLWSREAYERSGGWDPLARVNNDGDIMMRALIRGVPLVPVEGGSAFYRRLPVEEGSVSSARFSRQGREAQIYVILKIARMIRSRGMLPRYRAAVGEAFERLAEECGEDHPDLRRECAALAAQFDRPLWLRATARRGERVLRRAWRKATRR